MYIKLLFFVNGGMFHECGPSSFYLDMIVRWKTHIKIWDISRSPYMAQILCETTTLLIVDLALVTFFFVNDKTYAKFFLKD
jgi:hypothetical protein